MHYSLCYHNDFYYFSTLASCEPHLLKSIHCIYLCISCHTPIKPHHKQSFFPIIAPQSVCLSLSHSLSLSLALSLPLYLFLSLLFKSEHQPYQIDQARRVCKGQASFEEEAQPLFHLNNRWNNVSLDFHFLNHQCDVCFPFMYGLGISGKSENWIELPWHNFYCWMPFLVPTTSWNVLVLFYAALALVMLPSNLQDKTPQLRWGSSIFFFF